MVLLALLLLLPAALAVDSKRWAAVIGSQWVAVLFQTKMEACWELCVIISVSAVV
jgi:hypothetical protein